MTKLRTHLSRCAAKRIQPPAPTKYRHPYSIVPARQRRRKPCFMFLRTFWMEILGIVAAIVTVVLALIGY